MQRESSTTPQHTPTPWAVYRWHETEPGIAYIFRAGESTEPTPCHPSEIACILLADPGTEGAANADLIVHRVNVHAALVEALDHPILRQLLGEIEDLRTPTGNRLWSIALSWFEVRDAALAAAKVTR